MDESIRGTTSISEAAIHSESSRFNSMSNEHILFASTLRDWTDPLLHGQAPKTVPLCPRCAICKCESLKDLPQSSSRANRRHHHHHPSCPNFRHHHRRANTTSTQRTVDKPKRRANSYDGSISLSDHQLNTIDDHSISLSSIKTSPRKKSNSRIPVRVSNTSSSNLTTTVSEYSSASSIQEDRTLNRKTRIPRPISSHTLPSPINHSQTIKSNTDDDVENYDSDR